MKLARRYAKAKDQRKATVLVVIDQFEELLIGNSATTENKTAQAQQKEFLAWLGEALVASQKISSCPIMFLATMRSDFLTEYQKCEELQDVKTLQESVKPIPKANFGELIEAPAQKAGIELEPGLVPIILEDLGTENALPLLAYTLYELWDKYGKKDFDLTIDEYNTFKEKGGVEQSINNKAEQIWEELEFEDNNADVKQAFLKLVQINESDKYIRKRAKKSDLPIQTIPFLDKLVDNRLLYIPAEDQDQDKGDKEAIYEVTHEAIFSAWEKLKEWLKENQDFLKWRRRFDESYKTYVDGKRDDGLLLNGTLLSQSLDWQNHLGEQEQDEKEFIRLSERKQKRAKRRLQGVSLGAVIFGIAASYLWIGSSLSSQEAQFEARAANIKVKLFLNNDIENLLESIELAGDNQKFNNRWFWLPQRWFKPKNKLVPEAQSVFYQAVEASRNRARITFEVHEDDVSSVAFSPDGKYLVSGSSDGKLKLWLGADWQVWAEVACKRERLNPTLVAGETDAALGAANTCIEYGNWSDEEKAEFDSRRATSLVRQGLALAEEGDAKQAKKYIQQASKLDFKNVDLDKLETEAKQLAAQTLTEQGLNLAKIGKIKEARNQIKQAHKLDPDSVDLDKLNEEVDLLIKNSKNE